MSEIERRALMKGAALSALVFTADGAKVLLSPRQARAQNIAFKTLTPEQVETLEAMGETLVPGSKQAGISHFVDQQLSVPPGEALLEARILNVRPPYANFSEPWIRRARRTTATVALPNSKTMNGPPSSI
jgi:hypothetical protein